MPKRKRAPYSRGEVDPTQELELQKKEVDKKLVHGRKVLNRALKTARGFERQKLGKRIKLTADEQDGVETGRWERELQVLKALDLSIAVESHLYKTILKAKSLSESDLLPSYVKSGLMWNKGSSEELSAISNVTARLYNTKPVKDAMAHIMGSIYAVLGIQSPSATTKNKNIEMGAPELKDGGRANSAEHSLDEDVGVRDSLSSAKYLKVFEVSTALSTENPDPNSKSDIESTDMRDALIGGSFDEESSHDVDRAVVTSYTKFEPETSEQPSEPPTSLSHSSQSPSLQPKHRRSTRQAQHDSSKPGSTFLPTLLGGYWSGSESATDDEDAPTRKKNRPGQQARRVLWEKKFGAKANHLKGQALGQSRDRDWDPRRGARGGDETRFRGGRAAERGGKAMFMKNRGLSTDENAIAVKPRARGMGKKDDTGPLHPSWEAAKKAKDAKKAVPFQGKKVVFE